MSQRVTIVEDKYSPSHTFTDGVVGTAATAIGAAVGLRVGFGVLTTDFSPAKRVLEKTGSTLGLGLGKVRTAVRMTTSGGPESFWRDTFAMVLWYSRKASSLRTSSRDPYILRIQHRRLLLWTPPGLQSSGRPSLPRYAMPRRRHTRTSPATSICSLRYYFLVRGSCAGGAAPQTASLPATCSRRAPSLPTDQEIWGLCQHNAGTLRVKRQRHRNSASDPSCCRRQRPPEGPAVASSRWRVVLAAA